MSQTEEEKNIPPSEDDAERSSIEGEPKSPKPSALAALSRSVSLKGFKNNETAIQLLLDKIDVYEYQCKELGGYRDKFHEKDKRVEVLSEQLKSIRESISGRLILITIGGILFGYLPSLWSKPEYFVTASIVATVFILIGYFKNK